MRLILNAISVVPLLETAQLTPVNLDTMCITVFGNVFLVNLVLACNGECLRAGDPLLYSFCRKCLRNLVSVHGNNVLCTS